MKPVPSDTTSAGDASPDDGDASVAKSGLPRWVWLAAVIVVATLAAYGPVYSAGYIWDDDDYVTQNTTLRDGAGLRDIWFNPTATPQYYPLVYTTFWIQYQLWGLQPLSYHLVNVLLHIMSSLLLWRLLAKCRVPGAWLMAAVFALHPVCVESVAWVTERKNVLSAVFYLAAALCYWRFAGGSPAPDAERRRGQFYLAALGFFVAALLSKTVACSLPAALLLVLWWRRDRLRLWDVLPLAPFFAVGIAMGLTTAWLEKHHVGAQGPDWALTFGDRSLIAGRALCFYAGKLVWPAPLVFIYPRWAVNTAAWWQWLFPGLVAAAVAALWLARRRIGKGPLVAVLFFCGTLLPALGFINVYPMRFSFVADHFQYLASIGIIAVVVGLAVACLNRWPAGQPLRAPLVAMLLAMLALLTWRQCGAYQDLETLWRDTLKKNPQAWIAHSNLGRLLAQQQKFDEAESHYRAALAIKPEEDNIHYNYANLLVWSGRLDEAVVQYQDALKLNPSKAEAHSNLGIVFNRQHRADDAIAEYELAIRNKPDYADAYFNLGNALWAQKRLDAAVAAYQRAARLNPGSEQFQKRLQAVTRTAN